HVAGAAALLLSYDDSLSPDELQDILQQSADKVGGYNYNHDAGRPGHSVELGYGRLNVNRALQMLMARTGAITDLLPTPLDLALSIDRSGSMTSTKLDALKNAASQVVRLMNIGDNLGISIYDDRMDPLFPAAGGTIVVSSDVVKDNAETAINSITRRGLTSIGGGLDYAQTQLETITSPNYPQAIILMSDGFSNTAPWIKTVVPTIPGNTDVYTIGFGTAGETVDEDSLQWIASQTGGIYLFAGADALMQKPVQNDDLLSTGGMEIIKAYQHSLNKSSNRQTSQLFAKPFKEKFDEPILVDESVHEMRFSFLGEDPKGTYSLLLFTPSNKKIDPAEAATNPNIDYVEGKSVCSYSVRKPEKGEWHMVGTGTGRKYYISASAYSSLKGILTVLNRGICRPMLIMLRLIQMGEPILGANVEGRIGLPNNEYVNVKLYDDGEHGDGLPRDGAYACYFDNTCAEGSYTVETLADGVTREQIPFTRFNMASTFFKKDPEKLAIFVTLPHLIAPGDGHVLIPIHLNPDVFGRGIRNLAAEISFDPDVLRPTKELPLRGTLLAEKWQVQLDQVEASKVQIRGEGPPLNGRGILLNMLFQVRGKMGQSTKLLFENFKFQGEEKEYDVRTTNGSFRVGEIQIPTAVRPAEETPLIPEQYALLQNYPNPFNPGTRIQYDLPVNAQVVLSIYNILGQEVIRLVDARMPAGYHTIFWNGCDRFGQRVAGGIYLYRLKTDQFVQVRKMYLLH
ncbi:VWA domain-containing protein, partial [candidate division KSB1 bacterium]|nr:VWA domain-containing protein [candidate division KSB1 bacterium]